MSLTVGSSPRVTVLGFELSESILKALLGCNHRLLVLRVVSITERLKLIFIVIPSVKGSANERLKVFIIEKFLRKISLIKTYVPYLFDDATSPQVSAINPHKTIITFMVLVCSFLVFTLSCKLRLKSHLPIEHFLYFDRFSSRELRSYQCSQLFEGSFRLSKGEFFVSFDSSEKFAQAVFREVQFSSLIISGS